ncbi:MAG: geranylgeranylglycerol-phosphate geranylgeranyltransferase [Candidatus Hodarchaeales archaeon]|jgi:geranylgeranylglycerol-phosphate geranylgeranyltransferase
MQLKAYFSITRPFNSVMAGLGVMVCAISSVGIDEDVADLFVQNFIALLVAGIACAFITAGGYVINDFFDHEIDLVNQPQRSIPSGAMSPAEARTYAYILFLTGIIVSFFIREVDPLPFDLLAVFLAILGVIGVYAYSYTLKKTGFVGNVTVSAWTAIPFLYGGVVVQNYAKMWIPVIFVFTISMGREIIKDIEDIKGDTVGGMLSLPMRIGVKKATLVALTWLVVLLVLIPVPFFLVKWYYSISYLIFVGIIVVILVFIMYYLNVFTNGEKEIIEHSTTCKRLLKTCMFLGIFAFILTPVTPISL